MEVLLSEITCCNCKISFWITKGHDQELSESKKSFFCPNGHSQSYVGESYKTKFERERKASKSWEEDYNDMTDLLKKSENKIKGYKGQLAKIKKKELSK